MATDPIEVLPHKTRLVYGSPTHRQHERTCSEKVRARSVSTLPLGGSMISWDLKIRLEPWGTCGGKWWGGAVRIHTGSLKISKHLEPTWILTAMTTEISSLSSSRSTTSFFSVRLQSLQTDRRTWLRHMQQVSRLAEAR